MNATTHTASVLDNQRAAQLDRENELLRRHSERPAASASRHVPTGFAVVTDWFAKALRPLAPAVAH